MYCLNLCRRLKRPNERLLSVLFDTWKGIQDRVFCCVLDYDLQLSSWCDSDWAGCPLTHRSLTRWFVLLGSSPISWKTKKQQIVSRSSVEAEYWSMTTVTGELKWLNGLVHSLGISPSQPMRLHCDSQAALHIIKNPIFHEHTKHIEVDCHFTRESISLTILHLLMFLNMHN